MGEAGEGDEAIPKSRKKKQFSWDFRKELHLLHLLHPAFHAQ